MATQINWDDLNSRTIFYAASSIDPGLTPPDGSGQSCARAQLHITLSDFLEAAKQKFGAGLANLIEVRLIADTLVVDVDSVTFPVPLVEIVAREIQVTAGAPDSPAKLVVQNDAPGTMIVLLTAQVSGNPLLLGYAGSADTAPTSTAAIVSATPDPVPTLFQYQKNQDDSATLSTATDDASVAGVMAGLVERNSLLAGFVAASYLIYADDPATVATGGAMLRWINNCSASGTATPDQLDPDALATLRKLQWQSAALLPYVDARNVNAIYVPILSADFYRNEIAGWLQVAQSYDASLNALAIQSQLDQTFAAFANTLGNNTADSVGILVKRFDRLYNDYQSLQGQYDAAVALFKAQQQTVSDDRDALSEAIKKEELYETIMTIINTILTIYSLGVSAAEVLVGDPVAAEGAAKQVETMTEGLVVGRNSVTLLRQISSTTELQDVRNGGSNLFKILGLIGEFARATLEKAAEFYETGATDDPSDVSPPAYGQLTIDGIDPETYWDATFLKAKHQIDPLTDKFAEAKQYLDSMQLMCTYGKSISAKQIAMAKLSNELSDTMNQIEAQKSALARWAVLANSLQNQQQLVEAKKAFILETYTEMKRALLVTVMNYRNAYLYRWLQPSSLTIDLNMDYAALQTQMQAINSDLESLLSGQGNVVNPPQDFSGIAYTVPVGAGGSTSFDENGVARWAIGIDDTVLSGQLTDHKALYLDSATFLLDGAQPNAQGEIELTIRTSGSYYLAMGGTTYHFVTKAVSLDFIYKPGSQQVVTAWAVSSEISQAYLRPSPYTEWTLTAKDGTDVSGVTALHISFSGHYLRAALAHVRAV